MSNVLVDSLDWPLGQAVPSVGDEIHYTGKELTMTVQKRVFEFNDGKLLNVKLYFVKP
jgi:hypothetical protein